MKYKPLKAMLILFIFVLMSFITCFANADDQATVNIHMIHQDSREELNRPVIVAKIWHYINVTPESNNFQQLTLEFYKGNSKPGSEDRDSTNYYEWEYDANTQQWADTLMYSGYNYLNSDLCQINGNIYSFCVGVSLGVISYSQYYKKGIANVYYENFTLKAYSDDTEIYSGYAVVEIAITGMSKGHADKIIFNVDPFTEMVAPGNDYFRIGNGGNIPLIFDIDYGKYDDIIEVPDLGIIVPPFGSTVHDGLKLSSESWRPGVINIAGPTIEGAVPEDYTVTTSPLSFDPVIGISSPNIEIRVGWATLELEEEVFEDTDISFQYPASLSMGEGEEEDITVYVSGNGAVTLNFRTENIRIKKIIYQNVETSPPITVNSKNSSEYPIKIRIEALRENIDAELIYDLSYGGATESFSTSIDIGSPVPDPSPEGGISPLHIIAVVGIFALVVIYMLNTRRKHRWR